MRIGDLYIWPETPQGRLMIGNKAAFEARSICPETGSSLKVSAKQDVVAPRPIDLENLGTFALHSNAPIALWVSRGFCGAPLKELLSPLSTSAPPSRSLAYHVCVKGDQSLWEDGRMIKQGPLPIPNQKQLPDAFNLTFELLLALLEPSVPAAVLHGAVVEWHGKRIAFLGVSGSGKTTLSCYLAGRAGASLLTDDYIVVLPDGCQVFATPMAPAVKEGSWPLLGSVLPSLKAAQIFEKDQTPLRYVKTVATVPPGPRGVIDLIVFPKFSKECVPGFSTLSDVETVLGIAQAGAWVPSEQLEQTVEHLCSVPSIALRHGPDLTHTLALLEDALSLEAAIS